MPHNIDSASLFSAALETSRRTYGQRPRHVEIVTQLGLRLLIEVPPDWEPAECGRAIRCSPDCFAEVLQTLLETGHRLTRSALLSAMEEKNRRRAESSVCVAIEDLQKLGIIDNRSDVNPRGYGLPAWQ